MLDAVHDVDGYVFIMALTCKVIRFFFFLAALISQLHKKDGWVHPELGFIRVLGQKDKRAKRLKILARE